MLGKILLLRSLGMKNLIIFVLGAFFGTTFPAATNYVLDQSGIKPYIHQVIPASLLNIVGKVEHDKNGNGHPEGQKTQETVDNPF